MHFGRILKYNSFAVPFNYFDFKLSLLKNDNFISLGIVTFPMLCPCLHGIYGFGRVI